ncbi:probable serine/threonine-protein kinase DDB_G0278901 isoform X2 [Bombyx mori]|uniref:Serine/threonine-protein kinase receptor n=1 Tax=Bombyx mori TaxID=7091 RepID=A0A8R2M0L2_BOMMO|nr:probable serine/threonine-protein kinase DDB_G0278901 isoform X2 [Bombyx mori]
MGQKVIPILKCIVLFLFIFTAKVLTSNKHDSQEVRNSFHLLKAQNYIRTFTKYHHRRNIHKNNDINNFWLMQDRHTYMGKRDLENLDYKDIETVINEPLSEIISSGRWFGKKDKIRKRSVTKPNEFGRLNDMNSNELVSGNIPVLSQFAADSVSKHTSSIDHKISSQSKEVIIKNEIPSYIKNTNVKNAIVVTDPPTTMGPTISCIYKMQNVFHSATLSYDDDTNAQTMTVNDVYRERPITDMKLETGETVRVEHCTHTRDVCYTFWHMQDQGNITILGQGCWRSAETARGISTCDKCMRAPKRLPGSKFCCCTKSYCNSDFLSLKEETVTISAESTMNTASQQPSYSSLVASSSLALVAILVMAIVVKTFYCKRINIDKGELSDGTDVEKGDIMGNCPDSLSTGLLCVDNLTLIEHIGQGKFGSVWRGSLGSTPVAVKLYSSSSAWQKETAIYALPHLSHPNLLRYYGSETRPTLTEGGGREHLVVLELCVGTLRAKLQAQTLSWLEFATLAHGIAAALAHLHTPIGNKPCVVHRDVNSNNVLIASNGTARLADLGLAQVLQPRREHTAPNRITEAGTLRYLAPEALEGALDLSGARAALCAVDVYALGLVLWELLWRTAPAHSGPTPCYMLPYQHLGLPANPTLHHMQTLVSRKKARPPVPRGPGLAQCTAADTCDECCDHDAEARLTAVCVEERMAELKQILQAQGPLIHDNNLHPNSETSPPSPADQDKNSNCTALRHGCDVTTPLLYPHPHMGRNACIERNTHTSTQQYVTLIHKSLKDISDPSDAIRLENIDDNCLSVARGSPRVAVPENSGPNVTRSHQRPLDYVQNDVSHHDVDRGPKQTNLLQETRTEKTGWGIRKFFEKFNKNKMDTEVKLAPEGQRTRISVVNDKNNYNRPSNLVLSQDPNLIYEAPCLSPPNRTLSPNMMADATFKEIPSHNDSHIYAVIVPKVQPDVSGIKSKNGSSSESLKQSVGTSASSQSVYRNNSESGDWTLKNRLSRDNKPGSNSSSRASINLELQFIEGANPAASPFELNSDCSGSEDEQLLLLSENGGSRITMQTVSKDPKYQNDVLKESQKKTVTFNKNHNRYSNFDNEVSDPNDKENVANGYSGDNPAYLPAPPNAAAPAPRKPTVRRQRSLEQVSDIFSTVSDVKLVKPAGRVKTPGDLPVALRKARRDRALQKGRESANRLSLYDDSVMLGNTL